MTAPPPAQPPGPGAPYRARPPRPPGFSPRFTLSLFYIAAFLIIWALLLALPDLLAGARELPPGADELSPAELARAREIARDAVTGRLHYALAAALATFGVLAWRGWLPGVRGRSGRG